MTEGNGTARWLLAVVAFLILYGSLYPFRFAAVDASGPLELLARLDWARTTRSDIAANLLLYLPFGACLAWMLMGRLGGLLAIVLATALGAALSTLVEVAQLYETRRVSSLTDVTCNAIGAFGGALLAVLVREAQQRLRPPGLEGALRQPIAAALCLLWLGYRLAPFAPTLDLARWQAAAAPLLDGPWLAPAATLGYLLPWLVVARALHALQPQGAGVPATALVMLLVAAGSVVIPGKALLPAEVVAMALTLALSWPLERLGEQRASALLAFGFATVFIVKGLAPFDFKLDPDAFSLVPFTEALTRYSSTNLPGMFNKCFMVGSLVWLLARAGNGALGATLLAGIVVTGIEVLQIWLPGKTAEITEPLLALAAGGLIALFEPGGGSPAPARRRR